MVDGAAAAFDVYMRGLRVSPGNPKLEGKLADVYRKSLGGKAELEASPLTSAACKVSQPPPPPPPPLPLPRLPPPPPLPLPLPLSLLLPLRSRQRSRTRSCPRVKGCEGGGRAYAEMRKSRERGGG
eukprot:3810846-Rhodomonas_salina.1